MLILQYEYLRNYGMRQVPWDGAGACSCLAREAIRVVDALLLHIVCLAQSPLEDA